MQLVNARAAGIGANVPGLDKCQSGAKSLHQILKFEFLKVTLKILTI